jgi:predicted RNA binding protein YcfA (HicA-like mRNA interferase family)
MSKFDKLLQKILSGSSDANVEFVELCNLLSVLGFTERVKGSHHIFTKDGIEEIINLQPIGNKAKVYQVKQVRNLILKYKLNKTNE